MYLKITNQDRDRHYGLRIGDIVSTKNHRGYKKLSQVIAYTIDNNKVVIREIETGKQYSEVAEWCELVTKVEDKKKYMQIIRSLLDTDKYKITMMQERYFHKNGYRTVSWKFTNRTNTDKVDLKHYHKKIIPLLMDQLEMMNGLQVSEEELEYLQSDLFHPSKIVREEFIDFLRNFKLDSSAVVIDANLEIWINGLWIETTLWETYLLSMYNELFSMLYAEDNDIDLYEQNAINIDKKLEYLEDKDFKFTEFGGRRRVSRAIHHENLYKLSKTKNCIGTSNMYLSMKYKLQCYGSIAHEIYQGDAGFAYIDGGVEALKESQCKVVQNWNEFYGGNLNIFLTDTFGTDSFLKSVDKDIMLTSTVRHDSGDPIIFANKMDKYFKSIGREQYDIIFSDGLNFEKCQEIVENVPDGCNPSFGIGSNLTADTPCPNLSIVCKLTSVFDEKNIKNVDSIKLSDNVGKHFYKDINMLNLYKDVFEYENDEKNNLDLIY